MRRSITGEREATFSILNLVGTVVGLSGNVETRPRRIEEILLRRSDVRKLFDAANDADPATIEAIADHFTSLLSGYRNISVPLDFTDFPTLQPTLSLYRPLIQNSSENIQLRFGSSFEDLSTKITNLEIQGGQPRRSLTQLFQDHVHVF